MSDYPTAEQQARAERVQRAICHEINLASREGCAPAELLAGLGAAIADLITSTAGPEAVGPWFARQAQVIEELQWPKR